MAEYIEREALMNVLDDCSCWNKKQLASILDGLSFSDVSNVVHGMWIFDHMTGERSYYARCSNCNRIRFFKQKESEPPFCDMCGAKMDKEDNDGN